MCGNFGLLALSTPIITTSGELSLHNVSYHKPVVATDPLDRSINESMHQVSKLDGIRFLDKESNSISEETAPVLKILEAQTACTEIRGGQAGGYSTMEYKKVKRSYESQFDSVFGAQFASVANTNRVRMVARKRHPLASDLTKLYLNHRHGSQPDASATVTVIGHTRFATSSINQVPELHPHEWTPFHDETVWQFNSSNGKFEKTTTIVGVHITHNGDFDAMEAYSQTLVVNEIGLWLERVLHVPNDTRSDSSKIAGCMDLMRVQGRWAASARLSWIRCVLSAATEVSGGEQLTKSAPNTFPDESFWHRWGEWFDLLWGVHLNNVIKEIPPGKFDLVKRHHYSINAEGLKQFVEVAAKQARQDAVNPQYGVSDFSAQKIHAFIHHAVRGFLYGDLYTALTELLSRAEGSFGLQAHCTLEPGVVVIASKGQPMSMSYDPQKPVVLFASEAEALAVPVFKSGKWLQERIDLDSHGEIFRLGEPRALIEGSFQDGVRSQAVVENPRQGIGKKKIENIVAEEEEKRQKLPFLLLDCGVEIRCYSLVTCKEATMKSLISRSVTITSAPIPYDPKADLVANDLKVTPAVLSAIDYAWSNPQSVERISGGSLAQNLVKSMQRRISEQKDTTDLIIGGVEVSLWLGEQFAADLRRIFPNLNVSTVSANKLLGVDDENANKVFFPGSDDILRRRIDQNTCVLLISQSGQTFATLHATRKMAKLAFGKVWILTGCFNSKMEQAVVESYHENNIPYKKDRVFNNYSGHRPAEPSSVAVAATWHTLTRFLMNFIDVSRKMSPGGRMIHAWERDQAVVIIQSFIRRILYLKKKKLRKAGLKIKQIEVTVPETKEDEEEEKNKTASIKKTNSMILGTKRTLKTGANASPQVVMNLSDGCIDDIKSLVLECLIPNLCDIVGYDQFGQKIERPPNTKISNDYLIDQGLAWAAHVNEPWHILVLVGLYIIISVGIDITIFAIIGDAILAIIRACGADLGEGYLAFTPRIPSLIRNQGIGYTLIGALLQLLDGIFFVYIAKNFTRWTRIIHGRPLAARHGKRTLVIVDTPCVHQLTEIFVSKLFSQSYSIVSIDVHGASGLDHFVHRFTHRVVRGLLIVVGRPDGRLCCLAKSEASTLLAAKQAAFIRNPDYHYEGNGPEIVTIGHNPFQPNLGLAKHIVLENKQVLSLPHFSTHHSSTHGIIATRGRRKFVDEYIYDRLFLAQKPFTISILRSLRRTMEQGSKVIRHHLYNLNASTHGLSSSTHLISAKGHQKKSQSSSNKPNSPRAKRRISDLSPPEEPLPLGVHHIDPQVLVNSKHISMSVFADFVAANKELLNKNVLKSDKIQKLIDKSCDPAVRLAFSSKLDSATREIQDLQVIVQQFYECRIASLERYIAYCVMFHTMGKACASPRLLFPWDIARSQSNLRVATTASPISAGGENSESSQEVKKIARQMAFFFRKFQTNF